MCRVVVFVVVVVAGDVSDGIARCDETRCDETRGRDRGTRDGRRAPRTWYRLVVHVTTTRETSRSAR
jgi:hypothetical protein